MIWVAGDGAGGSAGCTVNRWTLLPSCNPINIQPSHVAALAAYPMTEAPSLLLLLLSMSSHLVAIADLAFNCILSSQRQRQHPKTTVQSRQHQLRLSSSSSTVLPLSPSLALVYSSSTANDQQRKPIWPASTHPQTQPNKIRDTIDLTEPSSTQAPNHHHPMARESTLIRWPDTRACEL